MATAKSLTKHSIGNLVATETVDILMLFLANLFGWFMAHLRLILTLGAILILLIAVAVVYKRCSKPPYLDEAAIQKAQKAIAENDRKVMVEVLAESDVKEQALDDTIKGAEQATEDAKKSYADKTNKEIADELDRRASQ